ncbi:unnamed protein product [Paramecium octaurelia]|uniref:Uncharacterized protein n=1 Tax=Paramecium octaurelia TaxID=43137 RepID=A0A8S1T571_PAROT|nr:unnamed protein product [Paramecium octaurelia]
MFTFTVSAIIKGQIIKSSKVTNQIGPIKFLSKLSQLKFVQMQLQN